MRVLFCSYQAVSMPGGGVLTQIMQTKKGLEEWGIHVEMFNQWKRYDWKTIDLVHIFSADMRNHFLLQALPSDVPIVVSPIIDKTLPFLLLKLLVQLSSLLPHQVLTSYKTYQLGFRKAALIIAPSPDGQRMLTQGFGVPENKIRIVYNGVSKIFLNAQPDTFIRKYGFRDFVLYAGQIGNPRKNLRRLLHVAQKMPDIPFILIGPILENENAKQIISLAHEIPNVHILGRVPLPELISAYAACSVFALPSLIEGTGLVALEAGLAGAKIVITQNGGPPDYFGSHAIYVNPKSESSIMNGIKRALTTPPDELLRNHIIQNFLWENIATQLARVYAEIVPLQKQ